jgi:hypothetical protein
VKIKYKIIILAQMREKLCKNSCMTEHMIENHNNSQQVKQRRFSGIKSPFMKTGLFLKEKKEDNYFDFSNFNLKQEKNFRIGSGAFVYVFLAKHKKDFKLFAIKQMDKNRLIIENGESFDINYREISLHLRIVHENIVRLY